MPRGRDMPGGGRMQYVLLQTNGRWRTSSRMHDTRMRGRRLTSWLLIGLLPVAVGCSSSSSEPVTSDSGATVDSGVQQDSAAEDAQDAGTCSGPDADCTEGGPAACCSGICSFEVDFGNHCR